MKITGCYLTTFSVMAKPWFSLSEMQSLPFFIFPAFNADLFDFLHNPVRFA
jgi:hypothetical protein